MPGRQKRPSEGKPLSLARLLRRWAEVRQGLSPEPKAPSPHPVLGCHGSRSSAGPEKLLIAPRCRRPRSICCFSWSVLKL